MKKEYFNIPNLMGYFRILMLPVFLVLYGRADSREDYIAAFSVLVISLLTDFFDGKIARKFNMVTDFGKALDPIADKLTQGTLALAVSFRYTEMVWVLILFFLKEAYMGLMGLYLIRKKHIWSSAKWHGKVCTFLLDVGIVILLMFPEIPAKASHAVIGVMAAWMVFSLFSYVMYHAKLLKKAETFS